MAQSNEVADELKDPNHIIPMDVWNKIRKEAEEDGS